MHARWLGLVSMVVAAGCDPNMSYGNHSDLYGHVTIDGRPAAGVTVVATINSRDYKVQAGPLGAYAFHQIPLGLANMRVDTPFVVFDPAARDVVIRGSEQQEVNFEGYSPVAISGNVVWKYERQDYVGISGVPVHIEGSPFPVPDAVSAADGSFRFAHAPGHGAFPVVFGALPAGLVYADSDRWTYRRPADASQDGPTHTAFAVYRPAGELYVEVRVDGHAYYGVTVHLNTPIPVAHVATVFSNLPVQALEVSIDGFPPSISFDSTVKRVQLQAGRTENVFFIGYSPGTNRPPTAAILGPANGATFTAGTPITFRGAGHDFEDGYLAGSALEWVSPTGLLGHGDALTVDTLGVGQYIIVLRATDSGGRFALTGVTITIVPATGGRVVGSVTVNNGPSAGTRVDLSTTPAQSTVTDAQGAYAFEDVPAGAFVVAVESLPCISFTSASQPVTVAVGVRTSANFVGRGPSSCPGSGITPGRGASPGAKRAEGGISAQQPRDARVKIFNSQKAD